MARIYDQQHLNLRIFGRVQGVFFRRFAQEKAKQLGISGFARNEADGTVYIEAEGETQALQKFVEWCQTGPPLAQVTKVEIKKGVIKNFKDFEIY